MHTVGADGGLPQKPQISVTDGGQIKIGDRVFNVKISGNLVNDPLVIEKVKGLLIKNTSAETLHAQLPESAGAASPDRVRIKITQEGVSVHKGESKMLSLKSMKRSKRLFNQKQSLQTR